MNEQPPVDFTNPLDFTGAQQLLITSRSGPLVWPSDNGTEYDFLFACPCTDLRVFYTCADSSVKYAYANCAEHGWRALGLLLKPASGPRWERAENRRRSGCTTERWHQARGGAR